MLTFADSGTIGDFTSIETWMIFIWLGIFIASIIIELVTTQIVSIWFAGAAFITLILSVIPGVPYWAEIIVFAVCSVLLLVSLRPLAKKFLDRKTIKTNTDELIGKKALVVKDIKEFDKGEVKVSGLIWTAESSDPKDVISKDSVVTIVAIEGNKLIVRKQ